MKNAEQVQLSKLVFTHNWEDPRSDELALNIQADSSLFAITSGGCNVLGFLLKDPKKIYSVDINLAQSYVLELKIAGFKALSFEEFSVFSGLEKNGDRELIFEKVGNHLSPEALTFWKANQTIISQGFLMAGKYERFVIFAGKFLNFLQGKKMVVGLFDPKSKKQQQEYFDNVWNTRRFKYLFKILFNKWILAKRGLVADYFHFDDGSSSFSESFYKRSKIVFRDLPIEGNYFLSLYLLGKYRNRNEVPEYLKKSNFETIKSRVDRVKIVTQDAQSFLNGLPDRSIDCFALSNICELMSEEETSRLFRAVLRTANPHARVIFRNLIIPREVPEELKTSIVKDDLLSEEIFKMDRSFVYGKVSAYSILK